MVEAFHPLKKYIRPHVKKTTFCPGCGNGIVAQAILRAIDDLGLDIDDFVFVSGIGCSAWIPSPLFNADTLHTTHGRPVAYATGVKLALPEKNVMVVSGDGDLASIGGNHLIHAARRNLGIIVIMINNSIYGMTGGQAGPTSPHGLRTVTSPYGTLEYPFDIAPLVAAAGAPYVARWTTLQVRPLTRSIKKALQRRSFSFIEVISQCPVQFGRASGLGRVTSILDYYKKNSVRIDKASRLSPEEMKQKIVIGEFVDEEKPELTEQWQILWERLKKEKSQ
ncbi:thiamine pyrophosphate-dependent enzyme [Thermodesulforhabdus norvegica]|uniref:2-oxoglutarate ferredoxin oxidoreductase, beta subunit n=1 Tax=Thermodesulforhabdus norvegica TaxID=39841 RepID=A0A1I4R3F0_9BACT|nr:thiamine pyrophosphate-dependent enzyme [Thermodesulforhabdus norvegica]SFM46828.1 2-oxoglutarate ferredoxin oxidoreductase, beta subunit [Thermodesulforhabdus norvegica]